MSKRVNAAPPVGPLLWRLSTLFMGVGLLLVGVGLLFSVLGLRADVAQLKRFLRDTLYRHPRVVETTDRAQQVIRALYDAYRSRPDELRGAHRIDDYIAGMTDRYALREYERLIGTAPLPVR